jgi:hypothetical protein
VLIHYLIVVALCLVMLHAAYDIVVTLRARPIRWWRVALEGVWFVLIGVILLYNLGVIRW